jgi:hypothetical protein
MIAPVTFRFPTRLAPTAHAVSVVGPFNDWNPAAHRLHRTKDDAWTITCICRRAGLSTCSWWTEWCGSTQMMRSAFPTAGAQSFRFDMS